ncbi:gamma-glutamyl-gamma-aminobutyrate hydrolase family protein [Dasania sp. GY-MA-18]|uniref:gamma-glutamyl-gamma-aminobutyrate hydrolase n=1 Tax=Dasania phycosphaerae TaxID=2950436 RepID=A0A9J6RM82_9GAMM|nr:MULTISPECIES: gamma-glutamyl-gamma-aminobutyrate hydrolase family protein [Dasania]MCR8922865.1 gamma-glutamyl-gamma-aminobutyrate hydrolase family protein [Dasania sp. GY-MA-18]MCZ0865296.1 gamma-glutamyl-gamma-aminobutyrate hydrolase family protein [Dasania phycosphaerae]MCZ0869021.1 gamma-glutamyl-gamma-aminobutyrate hydrolase family protein [Dasania phycosphaerae]
MAKLLLIAVLCDDKQIGAHHFHSVGDKYVRAIVESMQAVPVLIPVLADDLNVAELLSHVDGLLLPGSYSNIDPSHYQQANEEQQPLRDPARDSTAFAVIAEAQRIGLPIFAICRGFQEVNVALGGSLYQRLQTEADINDHREDKTLPLEQQYEDAHAIDLVAGGLLASSWGKPTAQVNSLHQQGIRQLAAGLKIEAVAADGLIEAYSSANPDHFILGAQWHPEWQVSNNPFNLSLFKLFEQACNQYRNKKA